MLGHDLSDVRVHVGAEVGALARALNAHAFTVGTDARDAVKVAVMLEEVARCVHLSSQLGEPTRLDHGQVRDDFRAGFYRGKAHLSLVRGQFTRKENIA